MAGDGGEIGFKHADEIGVSGVEMTSMPLYGKADPFFSSADWDPVMSTMVSSNGFSSSHYPSLLIDNPGMSGFVHYPSVSGSGYVDMSEKLLPYGNEAVGAPNCSQVGLGFGANKNGENEGSLIKAGESHEHLEDSEEGVLSPSRKRRRPESESVPSLQWDKKAVEEFRKDVSRCNVDVVQDQIQKKTESGHNTVENSGGKIPTKESMNKDDSQSGEPPKENYIHVRARRGQATNSHSLAERVRREKISERMRLLQELVPGCNKITGKAVMLDEIINYVQSLQQQVEFLSMKLATVNPELNIDIERVLAKDLLHSRDRNTPMLGLGPGMNPSHPYGILQGPIPNISTTNPQFNPLPQTVIDSELQSLYHMGFVSNPSTMDSLSPNGRLKSEL